MNKRRKFIKKTGIGLLGLTIPSSLNAMSAKSYSRILGSNNRVNLAFQGLGRRRPPLLRSATKISDFNILYFCDVMDKQILEANKQLNVLSGYSAKSEKNIHKIFDDKEVDAIIIATPDHWHAYGACKAMEAGKHVYLEKPCSHNLMESELIVNYQKYYNKVVQMGNQQRSSTHSISVINQIHKGLIGDVYSAVAFYNNNRGRVPNQVIMDPPKGLDWDLFQGPAPRRKYTHDTWDYNWRWYDWDYGTGEAGNNATHELDIARWALNVDYPYEVNVFAEKNHFLDDGWTVYDNMEAKFKFSGNKSINWNGRSRNAYGKELEGGRGTVIYGTEGSVFINRAGYKLYDINGKLVKNVNSNDYESGPKLNGAGDMTTKHFNNFLESIKNGTSLNSPIDDAVISQSLVHYANISYRSDSLLKIDNKTGRIKDTNAMKFWSRNYEPGWEIKMK